MGLSLLRKSIRLAISLVFLCNLLILPIGAGLSAAAAHDKDHGEIHAAAESFFQNMRKQDYHLLWPSLTAESQKRIIQHIRKAMRKAGVNYTDVQIREDFVAYGEIAQAYWIAYASQFDPKTVLDESKWTMGVVRKDRAEIIIRYRKSRHDTILKMYRQGGIWKVGLEETFSTRRR